uniref:NADH dehydrogenase [ubiquinone] 1 beta subcomplex subunit 11, mitochondrial n=1 Tax=Scylla olivacea TaxID=85551 RepID=A0A0N7ZDC2_SCYOL
MAALTRLGALSLRLNQRLLQPSVVRSAGISTSKKNKDTVTVTDVITDHGKTKTESSEAATKNWVSWGFDRFSQVEDNSTMHMTFFVAITLCIVTTGFIWSYLPDFRMRDWAQREAFLELRRREALGLPAIDPDLVPLDKIELPEDEELGSREIII